MIKFQFNLKGKKDRSNEVREVYLYDKTHVQSANASSTSMQVTPPKVFFLGSLNSANVLDNGPQTVPSPAQIVGVNLLFPPHHTPSEPFDLASNAFRACGEVKRGDKAFVESSCLKKYLGNANEQLATIAKENARQRVYYAMRNTFFDDTSAVSGSILHALKEAYLELDPLHHQSNHLPTP